MRAWLKARVGEPLLRMLREGSSPQRLAWSLAVGLALGVTPLVGTSTLLCVGAGFLFRLNQPAMQLVNYAAYPLQVALLIPFIRLGERLFGAPPLPLSLSVLQAALKADAWGALHLFWGSFWHAGVAWLVVVPLPTLFLAWLLTPLLRATSGTFRRS
ncbi:DUF2062 domain-containing protein [Geothrix sp. 21YS21S-4]|uniref:DUF2062 domain-containing protein n=1 Tax=Geothrix sp. 21YS21S-4 TaxID=3068889 RepID=UPI0027BB0302|nr:DUF2062 domain-containing protein [Geothrix sp. 21YS21S-4]